MHFDFDPRRVGLGGIVLRSLFLAFALLFIFVAFLRLVFTATSIIIEVLIKRYCLCWLDDDLHFWEVRLDETAFFLSIFFLLFSRTNLTAVLLAHPQYSNVFHWWLCVANNCLPLIEPWAACVPIVFLRHWLGLVKRIAILVYWIVYVLFFFVTVTRRFIFIKVNDFLLDLLIFAIVDLNYVLSNWAVAFFGSLVLRLITLHTFCLRLSLVWFYRLTNRVVTDCLWIQSLDRCLLSIFMSVLNLHFQILIRSNVFSRFLIRLPCPEFLNSNIF